MVNAPGNTVAAAYFGLNAISIPDGQALFTFRFNVTNTSTIVWDLVTQGACQYSNFAGDPIPADFVNGGINAGLPTGTITSTPFICSGQPATVSISATGSAPYTFVYNDGVNSNTTVNTSANPYEFTTYPTGPTTYTLVSVTAGACSNSNVNATSTTNFLPAPESFTITGGGSVCENQIGVEIGLDGSQLSSNYELYLDDLATGNIVAGTGSAISFGLFHVPGTYTVKAINDCGSSSMAGAASISLLPYTSVTLSTFPPVCFSAQAFQLSGGLPEGGVYSGNGVVDGLFYPELAGTGLTTITYTFTEPGSCEGSAQQNIEVLTLPELNFYVSGSVCVNSDAIMLYGFPEGGVFSGTGVSDNLFNPAVAGVGNHTLTYTFSDDFGCSSSINADITVNGLPEITFELIDYVCHESAPVSLNATPVGGWFTGDYVYQDGEQWYFNATDAGPATYPVVYSYTDGNGCTATMMQEIAVLGLPFVSISTPVNVCANGSPVEILGTPVGGVFSGNGVIGSTFDPSLVLPGAQYPVNYTFTDEFGCSSTTQSFVYVNYLPYLEIYLPESVCENADVVQLTAYPLGGTFEGPGVVGGLFNPSIAGNGIATIVYNYTDEYGCTSSISGSITVNPAPANLSVSFPDHACANSAPFVLSGDPVGGVFDGTGVYNDPESGNYMFYPEWVGPGNYAITYSIGNEFGCYSQIVSSISVNAIPTVSFDLPVSICPTAQPLTLIGTPEGGVFSGDGVVGNIFDPSLVQSGTLVTINYQYSDEFGCSNSPQNAIYVFNLPNVEIYLPETICANAEIIQLIGYPAGGIFEGIGVDGSSFNPAITGAGIFSISYTYTDENGCTASISRNITVNPAPANLSINIPSTVCANSVPFILTGEPTGGIFDGAGVYADPETGNYLFYPEWVGQGTFSILYSIVNEFGCYSSIEAPIIVNPLPVVAFDLPFTICPNAEPIVLVGTPDGGTFSGSGVEGNTFNPSLVEPGSYQNITYSVTSPEGCNSGLSHFIYVDNFVTPAFNPPTSSCINGSAIALTDYTYPQGGVFTGTGVSGNTFNPGDAGVGSHVITYTYINESGCSGSTTVTITVSGLTELSFPALASICNSAEAIELVAYPLGGWFVGDGVSGGYFYPTLVIPGNYTLTYFFSNEFGCVSEISQNIEVTSGISVTFDPLSPVCPNAEPIALYAQPVGGYFSGPGVIGDLFYPNLTGSGVFEITYFYGETGACGSFASQTITVLSSPSISSPSNTTATVGSTATFSTSAANTVFLQWQISIDGGLNWNNLSNDGTYSGVDSENLSVLNVSLDMNNNMFRCNAYGDCQAISVSDAATLFVESGLVTITAATLIGCPGDFTVPVAVDNFFNVASLSLSLTFDPSVLTFNGFSDLNPQLENGFYSINVLNDQVKLGFFSIAPANIGSGLLVNYLFSGTPGYSALTWDLETPGNCQLVDLNDNILNVNYANGSLTIMPFPTSFEVTGGGVYCEGGIGLPVGLISSEIGVTYGLYFNNDNSGIFVLEGTGASLDFGVYTQAGVYSVMGFNTYAGCASNMGNVVIAINPTLFVNAGSNVTIPEGTSANLDAVVTGGTAPYTYLWTPANSLNDATIANPIATPLSNTTYTVYVTDFYGCTASSSVTVNVEINSNHFTGIVTYHNADATPMNDVLINLFDGSNTWIASTTTDANGAFGFNNLNVGTYSVTASTNKTWGGGNAADGLLMLKHFTGNQLLTGMELTAGDVTGNNKVNSHDALNTVKRFLGMLPSFAPVGDWLFESATIVIDGSNSPVVTLHSLCYGDVNSDYIPPFIKPEPTITINREGSILVNSNGDVVLPIISEQNLNIGAISMKMEIPSSVIVKQIVASNGENVLFNIVGNELRIGWYNLNPITVNAGETLMNLHLNVISTEELTIAIEGSSVLSDENAITIQGAELIIPKLTLASNDLSISSYPNPVASTSKVTYTLPNTGKVVVGVYSIIGEKIADLVNTDQEAGQHVINLDVNSISQGTYILKIESAGQVKTQLFTVSK